MGFHHTRAARERRKKKEGRKYSAYEGAVKMLRSLSMLAKKETAADPALTTNQETTGGVKAPSHMKMGDGNLIISVEIDKEAQDQMIRRRRKSLAQRLKERIMTRRVKPGNDSDEDEDEQHGRRGGCLGC